MNQISDISSHSFSKNDLLFLDTNIWLSVYGPITYIRRRASIYSNALRDIRTTGCSIFIDILVLSEFINAYAKWEYHQSTQKNIHYKNFRKSSGFISIAKDIANNVRRIINQCTYCNYNFTNERMEELLIDFENGSLDFNDQIFTEICKNEGLVLVTDDGDFKDSGLTILTANSYLLST